MGKGKAAAAGGPNSKFLHPYSAKGKGKGKGMKGSGKQSAAGGKRVFGNSTAASSAGGAGGSPAVSPDGLARYDPRDPNGIRELNRRRAL